MQGGSVNDPNELTYMLGELYAMKRRDAQLIERLTRERDALQERVDTLVNTLEAEKEAGTT